ncbi:MAG: metallophosphoesterase [Saprospiraceae bacterium]
MAIILRMIFLAGFVFLFDCYAFEAFKTIAEDWSPLAQTALYTGYWSIPILLALFFLALSNGAEFLKDKARFTLLRTFLTIAYFAKLLILGVLLLDDGRRILLSLHEAFAGNQGYSYGRSYLMAWIAVLLGMIPLITLTYGAIRNPYRYKIFKETIVIDQLPAALDGLRIVQISDIHSGSFTKIDPVRLGVEMINEQQPDLVFFTGDLVNSMAVEMKGFVEVFDKIEAKYGIFSVLGNHDYGDYVRWNTVEEKKQNFQNLLATHKEMGWDLMLNENRMVDIKGEKVAVIGVENYSAHPRFPKYGDLNRASVGTETASLKLLLSHDPTHWEDEVLLAPFQDIAITFSGHTHGFQFGLEIPGWFRWSPSKYIYEQWAGLYQRGKQFLYVNRGFGFLGYAGRVGILPEITLIELKQKSL